jgi:hypothetical protein
MAAIATTTARRARPSLEDVCCFNVAGAEKVQESRCWDEKMLVVKLFLPHIRFRPLRQPYCSSKMSHIAGFRGVSDGSSLDQLVVIVL